MIYSQSQTVNQLVVGSIPTAGAKSQIVFRYYCPQVCACGPVSRFAVGLTQFFDAAFQPVNPGYSRHHLRRATMRSGQSGENGNAVSCVF